MKIVTKFICPTFGAFAAIPFALAVVALAMGAMGPLTAKAAPGDLFESDVGTNSIGKFTLDGTRSTFATGLVNPALVVIQSAATTSFPAQISLRQLLTTFVVGYIIAGENPSSARSILAKTIVGVVTCLAYARAREAFRCRKQMKS
jgi:hypothetical protein